MILWRAKSLRSDLAWRAFKKRSQSLVSSTAFSTNTNTNKNGSSPFIQGPFMSKILSIRSAKTVAKPIDPASIARAQLRSELRGLETLEKGLGIAAGLAFPIGVFLGLFLSQETGVACWVALGLAGFFAVGCALAMSQANRLNDRIIALSSADRLNARQRFEFGAKKDALWARFARWFDRAPQRKAKHEKKAAAAARAAAPGAQVLEFGGKNA